jgi:hypothetical protein
MSPRTSRTDLRLVRDVLAYAEDHGPVITARKFDIDHSSVYRWRQYRAQFGPAWPTDADIADYDAKASARALNAARKRRYEIRVYLNRGPILMDATGSRRRLQALCRMGWTQKQIAAQPELDVSSERISQLTRGRNTHMAPDTVKAVAAVYRRLCRTIPTGPHADYARIIAEQKGWPGSGAWDDDTIDDPNATPNLLKGRYIIGEYLDEAAIIRRMSGEMVPLTKAERIEVVARLRAAQWSYARIEHHTGLKADRYIAREKAAA